MDYDTGLVIGAELKNGKVTTQIGFSAQTFIVYNPSNGKLEPVFAIKNGQVIFNDALISKATIENIIVGMDLRSKNYIPGQRGTRIDMVNGNFEVNGVSSTYRTRLTNKGFYVYSGNTPIIELGEFI